MDKRQEELKWIRKIKFFGSKHCADLLVRSYYEEIFRFCRMQLPNDDTAYDLTQEIFISMLRSIHSYKKEIASFRTWLYRIATNKVIDYRRQKIPQTVSLEEVELEDEKDFVKELRQKELLEKIEGYVSGYPASAQQIYRLHIYGEYTFGEISEIQGMPESSVKSVYYRLLEKIRKEFGDEYRGD